VSLPHLTPSRTPLYAPIALREQERGALAFLLPLSADYPGIEQWFTQKVVPGLRTGERLLLPVERDGELIALGIAKKASTERKICTVRVAPGYAARGLGVRLFDGLMKWLDDDRPHLTVNAAKLPAFERIFDYYRFGLTSSQLGRYRPDRVELGFNESGAAPTETLRAHLEGRPV
jgi:GNAT superfamily N-acetyltransferase